jgi:large subunit ribosomal protein L9
MKVILQQDVANLGKKGEVKDVAPGYARNHLMPRGIAVEATAQRLREWKQQKDKEDMIHRKQEEEAQLMADRITQTELIFKMPAGDGGRLFGSVTPGDVAIKLGEMGYDVDKKKIEFHEPVKSIGNYQLTVRLYPGVLAKLGIKVEKEE